MDDALRRKVANLLRQATDEKMLHGGGARTLLDEVRGLAVHLGAPWRQVAAYRLAHVLMRDAEPDLERASALFREAGEDDALGPLPWIYLAAVEHRLGRPTRPALQKARERLGRRPPGSAAGLQAHDHDMLELAVYFTGEPYWLAGHGGQGENLFPETGAWVLVGPSAQTSRVRYSRQMALAELAAREKEGAVVFEASGRIRAAGGKWRNLPEQHLRLLALILAGARESDLPERMGLTPEAYRQAKRRLGLLLAEVQGREGNAFTGPALGEVYGAVPAQMIAGCHT